jgi:hypothetical protein
MNLPSINNKQARRSAPGKEGNMKKQTLFALLLAMSTVLSAPNLQADIRLKVPEDNEPPFYSRISGFEFIGSEGVFRTEEWAAIVFYRDPGCVPGDFNLLEFFDFTPAFPDGPPRPFLCPLTVEGFEIWPAPPGPGVAPIQTKSWGLGAVPVWFVSWPEMQSILADRVVTVGELESAATLLKGDAHFFTETLHPPATGPLTEAAQVGHITINASGELDDGRQFEFKAAVAGLTDTDCCFPDGKKQRVIIRFR